MTENKIVLGYWPMVGLGQHIRYALAIVGANWQEKVYTDGAEWFGKDKNSLDLKFPNLPYLIDGQAKITESSAILRYVAKKFGREDLLGKTPEDYALVETYLGVISDVTAIVRTLMISADPKVELANVFDKVKDKLEQLQHNIVGPTALGYLTIADLKIATIFSVFRGIYKDKAGVYKKLEGLNDYVLSIPEVQKYREKGVTALFFPNSKLLDL